MDRRDRVWAEIDADAFAANFDYVKKTAAGSVVMPVIKADAYGHGALPLAERVIKDGAERFAVATAEEALSLRHGGIDKPIHIIGAIASEWAEELSENGIEVTLGSLDEARNMSAALKGRSIKAHFKLDTGMSRLGIRTSDPESAADELVRMAAMPGIEPTGIFTHFAVADVPDGEEFTKFQFARFMSAINVAESRGLKFKYRHCANSAAIIKYPWAHLDVVRPGIILYGSAPDPSMVGMAPLKPVMTLKTRVVRVTQLTDDDTVGYGRTWTASGERTVATVSIGYADGLMRRSSGRFSMLLHGIRVPQVGNICMDMCMLDVTGVEGVRTGDEVIVFGRSDDGTDLPVFAVADPAGAITYEALCAVGRRVPRYLKENGQPVKKLSYI